MAQGPATIYRAEPAYARSRPEYGFRLKFRWRAAGLEKDYGVFVHFVDRNGETVWTDDHRPPTPTSQWSGAVEYTRTVVLPKWIPRGQQSFPGPAEGEYAIYAGLHEKGKALALKAGPGVVADQRNRYRIGVLRIDRNAPIPQLGPRTLDLTGYRLTFQDEFDELSVSPWGPCGPGGTRWIAHTPYGGDFGQAEFADPRPGFPFTVKDGILRIEARKEGGRWRSGLLASVDPKGNGFSQRYGYFEMRAKLPKGPGTWPAFWLLGLRRLIEPGNKSLTNIEIDVLEQYGHWPNKLCTVVHQWKRGGVSLHDGENFVVSGMTDDFHSYGVMVTEEFITFYYDGAELRRVRTPECGKDPVYVLLDLALGPGWPLDLTPNPSFMEVDYVRVYAPQDQPRVPSGP